MFSNFFFFENRAPYEIMWKNMVEPGRPQMAVWRMRIECLITNARNTHSRLVILLFPLRQWLHECASMLSYKITHTVRLAFYRQLSPHDLPNGSILRCLRGISQSSCSIIQTNVILQRVNVPCRSKIQRLS